MTEEHLVADWVLRAFHRSRRLPTHFSGSLIGSNQLQMSFDPPTATARVLCRDCNNTWVSRINNDAAHAIRPLIQGYGTVELGERAQSAAASWVFKTALIFDVVREGVDGPLGHLRPAFATDGLAPPDTTIYVGPAPRIPYTPDGFPKIAQLVAFGVRPIQGTVNIMSPEGKLLASNKSVLPTPGWTLMLGRINAIISGRRGPIIPTPNWHYGCVWPTSTTPVALTSQPVEASPQEEV